MTERMNAVQLEELLSELQFPIGKWHIIDQAKLKRWPAELVADLRRLPDRDFSDIPDVLEAHRNIL